MEVGEPGIRQSGIPSRLDQRPRTHVETSFREGPTMATALVSPSPSYHHHQHHNSFSSGYPHSVPATNNIPGMISPVEPRRSSDGSEPTHSHRESLPSISEVISGTKPISYAQPSSAPMPPTQSLPSPFSASTPSRPFGDIRGPEKDPSPRALQPAPSAYTRPEPLPAFSDPARPALASAPVPSPLNTFQGQNPSPPLKFEQVEAEQRHPDTQPLSAGSRQQPGQPLPGLYSETGRLPPGQLPLSAYPISPRNAGPGLPSPYEPQRPSTFHEDGDYQHHRPSEYKAAFDKHLETWGYQEALRMVAGACRTGFNFADAYAAAAAQEQQGGQPTLSRMPTENEVTALINNLVMALKKLEDIREMCQQNRIRNERVRENGSRKPDDEDVSMYNDGIKPAYGVNEVKKRRGRAAPPGRCHSCNRIDTPEWRRGPDGARTLCNACGLHYAKLERKRQLDSRSIRPKPAEERK
ncbi:hypothetical protein VTK26DRAFT_6639 [Humicola hyalothermophila]